MNASEQRMLEELVDALRDMLAFGSKSNPKAKAALKTYAKYLNSRKDQL